MAPKRSIKIHCPTCKTPVKNSTPDFPFCSERCRLIDLGKWASGAYVVSSPIRDTSEALEESRGEDSEHK